jgi:assimilatory nitrate reductase catalytic subunit
VAGVVNGGLARVVSASGASVFRVLVTDGQACGQVFVPMHWTAAMGNGGRGNLMPDQSVDPVSGQPGFKNNACRIEPVANDWRAFLVRADAIAPDALVWWNRSRIRQGWLHELAGDGTVDVDALLPEGERIEAVDLARGMRRVAVLDADGTLVAALYITRNGHLPAREWIADQLGQSGAEVRELLAARPSAPAPDRGPIVCVCHGIGAKQIIAAAQAGAETVADVGVACAAGTNCGSCRPAIARLLREWNDELAEAAE